MPQQFPQFSFGATINTVQNPQQQAFQQAYNVPTGMLQ